ncbi:unnamed protein product [Toxocara canis]|uniref:HET domain-containing protein n=1 Tax=Toxocara canis TaxID=6265 RepID=A0A183V804_TOXCA|nr:unnamed protein product [Toxocara canis]
MAKVVSCMRTVYCYNGELGDDDRPFVDSRNESGVIAARAASTKFLFSSEAISHLWTAGSTNNSLQGTPVTRSVRPGDEEDELLNQILESTHRRISKHSGYWSIFGSYAQCLRTQNIIDVSHMEGSLVAGSDDLTRASGFEDAIKQHDVRVR